MLATLLPSLADRGSHRSARRAASCGRLVVLAALLSGCRTSTPPRADDPIALAAGAAATPTTARPALPLARIAILGASVSAGFGGMPLGDAFTTAAPRSVVESEASLMLFRDPPGDTRRQIDAAIAFRATTIVALDLLFWDVYGSSDHAWKSSAFAVALAELDRAHTAGAWILVGDVPHITTASEYLIPRSGVPSAGVVAAFNRDLATWAASRERVLVIPFAAWAAPLSSDGTIELAPGEHVPARSLVALDGLHPSALGVWALLDRLDHFIEAALPGTPPEALAFRRPPHP